MVARMCVGRVGCVRCGSLMALELQLSNMGEAPAQLRQCTTEGLSRKNNKWQKKLVEFRKNRRRLLIRSGHLTSIKTKLKVLTKKRYKEPHKNRSPK